MGEIAGGKNSASGLDTNLQQGQFEFGPSQFDLGAITDAVTGNTQMTENRYNQLGLGGSTMEGQDVTQEGDLGQAAIGQEQTSDVTNPALNPALQTAQTNLPTSSILGAEQQSSSNLGSTLGTLAGLAGKLL
jgi:hypothetical protein